MGFFYHYTNIDHFKFYIQALIKQLSIQTEINKKPPIMFHFKPTKLHSQLLLSKGRFSTIHPYHSTTEDSRYVVKVVHADTFASFLTAQQKIASGFNLNHPRIVKVHGFHAEEVTPKGYKIYVKLTRMHSDLASIVEDHIGHKTHFNEETLLRYLYEVIDGLSYLHSNNVHHGHIKFTNILLDAKDNIRLSGVGSEINSNLEDNEDTINQDPLVAPELLESVEGILQRKSNSKITNNSDLWSVGLVFLSLCLLDLTLIDPCMEYTEIEQHILQNVARARSRYSSELMNLISALLNFDPMQRGTANQMKEQMIPVCRRLTIAEVINTKLD